MLYLDNDGQKMGCRTCVWVCWTMLHRGVWLL